MTSAAPARALKRTELRRLLAAPRPKHVRGDDATAARLLAAAHVRPFDSAQFDPVTWGGLAGTPPTLWPADAPRISAAVLVPLVERASGTTVLLTQRTTSLKSHAGQISFPGGRLEASDRDADAGALRETEEEIGIGASHIEILGHLDPYWTVTGYDVTPVVGAVTPPFDLKPDAVEVADVFEVPLAFFLDPANHQIHSRTVAEGKVRAYYALPYGNRYIWGATAGMLINLFEVLTANA